MKPSPKAASKARRRAAEMAKLRPVVLAQPCIVCGLHGATHAHHLLMRSQGGQDTLSNLRAAHSECHSRIHLNPAESYERGWLLHPERRIA